MRFLLLRVTFLCQPAALAMFIMCDREKLRLLGEALLHDERTSRSKLARMFRRSGTFPGMDSKRRTFCRSLGTE